MGYFSRFTVRLLALIACLTRIVVLLFALLRTFCVRQRLVCCRESVLLQGMCGSGYTLRISSEAGEKGESQEKEKEKIGRGK